MSTSKLLHGPSLILRELVLQLYMHELLMEDEYQPSVEHQLQLNLAMKEVVKKEVLK